jgi:hypothetical protein
MATPPRRHPHPAAGVVVDGAPPAVVSVPIVVVIVPCPSPSPKLISTVWGRWWCSGVHFNAGRRIKMGDGVNTSPDYNSDDSDICWDIIVHQIQGQALLTSSMADYNMVLSPLPSSPPPSGSASSLPSLFRCRMRARRKCAPSRYILGVGTAIPPPLPSPSSSSSPLSPPDALGGGASYWPKWPNWPNLHQ